MRSETRLEGRSHTGTQSEDRALVDSSSCPSATARTTDLRHDAEHTGELPQEPREGRLTSEVRGEPQYSVGVLGASPIIAV